jgi:DNA-binding transcriptional LysR family regulator
MDLNAASMFVATVRAGSLSAGAAALGIPLATLSRRIRQLESDLRVQLLERSARGIKLTEPGTRLYDHAAKGLELLRDGEAAIRSDQLELRGRLRISMPPTFEPWWNILSGFQKKYPGIHLKVHVTERRMDLVQDGIDVALRVGKIIDESFIARRLLTFRHVLVASPSLIGRLGLPASAAQLKAFPCATWAPNSSWPANWTLGNEQIELDPVLSTNDYSHLRRCAEAGEVVTELPEFLARTALGDGRLQELLPDFPFPTATLYLLYLSHRNPSSIVRAYLDYCSSEAMASVSEMQ